MKDISGSVDKILEEALAWYAKPTIMSPDKQWRGELLFMDGGNAFQYHLIVDVRNGGSYQNGPLLTSNSPHFICEALPKDADQNRILREIKKALRELVEVMKQKNKVFVLSNREDRTYEWRKPKGTIRFYFDPQGVPKWEEYVDLTKDFQSIR